MTKEKKLQTKTKKHKEKNMSGLDKFMRAIDDVTAFIIGDKRSGTDRRVKKSTRKKTKRKYTRRK